ncbi:MAG TPA: cyanophycinase [Sphingomicrobium sp.]|nr:cyanophycinase [Sphingomicrobium sp.]
MSYPRGMRRILAGLLGIGAFALSLPASADVAPSRAGYSYYWIGDIRAHRPAATQPALLLSGGGDWNIDAFRWFAAKAGHGHIVMLGAYGGGEDGQSFFRDVGGVTSVETLVFDRRDAAFDPRVLAILSHADGIFIEGGDQSKYVRFWKGTPVARLINSGIRSGKPVGGTSAGLAILGGASYGAMDGGSIDASTALHNPQGPAITIVHDFLHMPFLAHVVTDTHFTARNRMGRLIAFIARVRTTSDARAVGLGIDQGSALCVDASGKGRLFTSKGGFAWLVEPQSRPVLRPGAPLDYPSIRITGVGPRSVIDLKTLRVSSPAFRKQISVVGGVLSDLGSLKRKAS